MKTTTKKIAAMTTAAIRTELRALESPNNHLTAQGHGPAAIQSWSDYLCEELGRRGEN
jgi:hypothetical protein